MIATEGFNQKVYQIVRVSHNTLRYNFFGEASKNFVFGLYRKEKDLAAKINLSRNSKLVDSSFRKFQTEFLRVVPKDFFDGSVVTNDKPINDTLDKTIWTETTLYSIDLKTKKIISFFQVRILFEGINVEDEKGNPKILNISTFTGKKVIDRKDFIIKQKHFTNKVEGDPPPVQN